VKPIRVPSPGALARIREISERTLTADEMRAALAAPIAAAEEEETLSLIRWFKGRYPTPGERLAYGRRAYRRWAAAQAPESGAPVDPDPVE
jgi:hypothetical protein